MNNELTYQTSSETSGINKEVSEQPLTSFISDEYKHFRISNDFPDVYESEDNKETTQFCPPKTKNDVFPIIKNQNSSANDYFDVSIKLSGSIKSVDREEMSFVAALHEDNSLYEREFLLSFTDVEENDVTKIVNGARIIYVYGKQYVNGTAYNSSKIIFRASPTYNEFKLKQLQSRANDLLQILSTDDFS